MLSRQPMNNAHDVLQTMITPAVLISATGTLILSTSNRTAKVAERVRELAAVAREQAAMTRPLDFVTHQLEFLTLRLLLLRSALQALYASMALYVAASLVIGFSNLLDWLEGWGAVWTGLLGAAVMLTACFQLVRESRLATRSSLDEVEHLRRELSGG